MKLEQTQTVGGFEWLYRLKVSGARLIRVDVLKVVLTTSIDSQLLLFFFQKDGFM